MARPAVGLIVHCITIGFTKNRKRALKGLVIAEPWIGKILAGEKTWEMRSRDTAVRGRIALIRKGSKTIVGVADLVGTVLNLSHSDLKASIEKHRVPVREIDGRFKHTTAWVLECTRPLREPIPYQHPAGAIVWVNLDPEISAKVEQQLPTGVG